MTPRHHSIEGASLLRRTLAAPLLWLTLGTALAAYFLGSAPAPATTQSAAKTTQATSTELKPRYVTKPIRDIEPIVDRVLARTAEFQAQRDVQSERVSYLLATLSEQLDSSRDTIWLDESAVDRRYEWTDFGPLDPPNWRIIEILMHKPDGGLLRISLARPLWWLGEHSATVGKTVQLDLGEMGAVGAATVIAIHDCPTPKSGPGRLVLGKFVHAAANVVELYVDTHRQPIGTTASHPFWSEDRTSFVPASELSIGETLRNYDGSTARVTRIAPRAQTADVYNLEVDGEHVYHVTADGILVHNTYVYREVVKGRTLYVGITNDIIRRTAEHLRNGRAIKEIRGLSNLSRKQARAVEHLLIEKLGRVQDRVGNKLGGQLANVNRGIDPRKLKNYTTELKWAAKKLKKLGLL